MKSPFPPITGRHSFCRPPLCIAATLLLAFTLMPASAATLRGTLEIAHQAGGSHRGAGSHGGGHKGGASHGGGHKGGASVEDVAVTLYEATEFAPIALATTTTNGSGEFHFNIAKDSSSSIFFLRAEVAHDVAFVAILGEDLPDLAIINEVTTVASSYSMAQFYRTGQIAGGVFRLRIAAMMYGNIVSAETGRISDVLRTPPNADQTNSLRLTRSLANLINACAMNKSNARLLLISTRDENGRLPRDCAEALANLARNPAQSVERIYRLSTNSGTFEPVLTGAPDQWTITVKLNDTGSEDVLFGGPANVAWDSWGYAWVSNNVVQGHTTSTSYNVVLRPDGKPADGTGSEPVSPFNTGGLLGVGWGVSVDRDDNIWYGNFGWGKPTDETFPSQTPAANTGAGTGSVSHFLPDGTAAVDTGYYGPYRVQGIEPDANGNIWMASFGDKDYDGGSGVWVFINGDPNQSANSLVDWENAPFGIAPALDGRSAWVTFSGGLAGKNQSSIAKYELWGENDLRQTFVEPVGKTLKVVAVDYSGNAWFASQGTDSVFAYDSNGEKLGEFTGGGIDGPWGLTVDGEGNIWVANFGPVEFNNNFLDGRLSKLCGANPAAWPRGSTLGDPISPGTGYTVPSAGDEVLLANGEPLYGRFAPPNYSPMMRQTSVKIDLAGNVWTINNWKSKFDVDVTVNPGGDGIIIFVGLAPPPP